VERQIPVDPGRTRFLIGSETKLFTAQTALQFVGAGTLDLNDVTPTRGVRSP
jgi:CubicO group peptidase (beta-lactamase class C family)